MFFSLHRIPHSIKLSPKNIIGTSLSGIPIMFMRIIVISMLLHTIGDLHGFISRENCLEVVKELNELISLERVSIEHYKILQAGINNLCDNKPIDALINFQRAAETSENTINQTLALMACAFCYGYAPQILRLYLAQDYFMQAQKNAHNLNLIIIKNRATETLEAIDYVTRIRETNYLSEIECI